MKKVFLMLFLALGASTAMAQSQKVFKSETSFRATLPEFSYDGKAQIFTYEGDLYGQTLTVKLLRHLRQEREFDTIESLHRQLIADEALCRQIIHSIL